MNLDRQAESNEWWRRYNLYLRSPEWRAKAALVLDRAHHRCEACGTRPATDVHHLTYKHVFDELLWELRAVCTECHEKLTTESRRGRG